MKKYLLLPLALILTSCDLSPFLSLPAVSSEISISDSEMQSEEEAISSTSADSQDSSTSLATSSALHDYQPADERYQPSNVDTLNSEEYYEFWDSSSKLTFDLQMSQENIARISLYGKDKNDPMNDLYFPADLTLTMNGRVYFFEEVGVRMKGNTSRVDFAPDGIIVSPANFKISFNELWDEDIYSEFPNIFKSWTSADVDYIERDDRTLFGMKKVDLKWNKSNDPAIISQPFINRFLGREESGIRYVPRATLGEIIITSALSSTNMGVYIVNEVIDKTLIKRFISDLEEVGDLYKATYNATGPANLDLWEAVRLEGGTYLPKSNWINEENLLAGIIPPYEIKTNENTTTHTVLINLLRAINQSEGDASNIVESSLQSTIDIPAFIKYAAASYLIGNPDDLRNNFNNYYMYFASETAKVSFIPYDNDWALGVGIPEYNFGGLQMADLSPLHTDRHIGEQPWQSNPLYWFLIIEEENGDQNWSDRFPLIKKYQTAYLQEVERLFNLDFFSPSSFSELYARYQNNYQNVSSDISSNSSFTGVSLFNEYYARLTAAIY